MAELIQDMAKSRIPKYNATFEKIIRTPFKKIRKPLKDLIWKAAIHCDFVQQFYVPFRGQQNFPALNFNRRLSEFYEIIDEMHDKVQFISELTKKCLDRQRVVCLEFEQCVRKVGFIDIL